MGRFEDPAAIDATDNVTIDGTLFERRGPLLIVEDGRLLNAAAIQTVTPDVSDAGTIIRFANGGEMYLRTVESGTFIEALARLDMI